MSAGSRGAPKEVRDDISVSGIELDDETIASVLSGQIRQVILDKYKRISFCYRALAVGARAIDLLELARAEPLPLKGFYLSRSIFDLNRLPDLHDTLVHVKVSSTTPNQTRSRQPE